MVLDRLGPDSLLWKLTGAIKNIGTPEDEQLQRLAPDAAIDAATLLGESERVYCAEPSQLWDETLDTDHLAKQWLDGEDARQGLEALQDWDVTETAITYFHTDRTIGYDMNITVEHEATNEEETLFYIGDLEYGISDEHAPAYLDRFMEEETTGRPDHDGDATVVYEEWLDAGETHEPPYVKDETVTADEAYSRLQDATIDHVLETEEGYRIAASDGEKDIVVETK